MIINDHDIICFITYVRTCGGAATIHADDLSNCQVASGFYFTTRISNGEILASAKEAGAKWLESMNIVKEIVVPGKLVNIVV